MNKNTLEKVKCTSPTSAVNIGKQRSPGMPSTAAQWASQGTKKRKTRKKNYIASLATLTIILSQCLTWVLLTEPSPSFLPLSCSRWRLQGLEAQFGWVGPFFFPSSSWFKGCNYLLLGVAVNWIKVEGLGWVDHPTAADPPPSFSSPTISPLGGPHADKLRNTGFGFSLGIHALLTEKWNFPTEGPVCRRYLSARCISSGRTLPETPLPTLSVWTHSAWLDLGAWLPPMQPLTVPEVTP